MIDLDLTRIVEVFDSFETEDLGCMVVLEADSFGLELVDPDCTLVEEGLDFDILICIVEMVADLVDNSVLEDLGRMVVVEGLGFDSHHFVDYIDSNSLVSSVGDNFEAVDSFGVEDNFVVGNILVYHNNFSDHYFEC